MPRSRGLALFAATLATANPAGRGVRSDADHHHAVALDEMLSLSNFFLRVTVLLLTLTRLLTCFILKIFMSCAPGRSARHHLAAPSGRPSTRDRRHRYTARLTYTCIFKRLSAPTRPAPPNTQRIRPIHYGSISPTRRQQPTTRTRTHTHADTCKDMQVRSVHSS